MWRRALAVVGLALAVAFLPQSAWASTTEPTSTASPSADPTVSPSESPSPTASPPSTGEPTSSATTASGEPLLVEFSGEDWQWIQALVIGVGLLVLVSMAALVGSWGGRGG